MSLRKDRLENLPIYFLNNPPEEVLSFKLLGHTICHDLSWESHISKLVSKASCRLVILCHTVLPRTSELLTTYKTFICSLMQYCFSLWGGAPAPHLARLHAVEAKAFRIRSISQLSPSASAVAVWTCGSFS